MVQRRDLQAQPAPRQPLESEPAVHVGVGDEFEFGQQHRQARQRPSGAALQYPAGERSFSRPRGDLDPSPPPPHPLRWPPDLYRPTDSDRDRVSFQCGGGETQPLKAMDDGVPLQS